MFPPSWTPPLTSLPTPFLQVVTEQWLWVPWIMHQISTGNLFYIWRKENPLALLVGMQTDTTSITVWRFLKTQRIKIPHDPEIPLLGICPKKARLEKGTCTPVFIAVLFTYLLFIPTSRTWTLTEREFCFIQAWNSAWHMVDSQYVFVEGVWWWWHLRES